MYENYEVKPDGSLKYPKNVNSFKPSLKEKIKRYILKHNLLPRMTKNSRYTIVNWFGYELILGRH